MGQQTIDDNQTSRGNPELATVSDQRRSPGAEGYATGCTSAHLLLDDDITTLQYYYITKVLYYHVTALPHYYITTIVLYYYDIIVLKIQLCDCSIEI